VRAPIRRVSAGSALAHAAPGANVADLRR
jgi:hypothetical protein